jgi:hypothetical protein
MNYIYTLEHANTVTTYLSVSCRHMYRHTPVFVNFNIEYSGFYTPQNTLFSKIMLYPSFYCTSVHIHIIYYNRES